MVCVHGEANARERAAELREQGPPAAEAGDDDAELDAVDEISAQVLVSIEGDKHVVNAPWLEAPEPFDDEGEAAERQHELREAGPPDGWEPPAESENAESKFGGTCAHLVEITPEISTSQSETGSSNVMRTYRATAPGGKMSLRMRAQDM